MTHREKTSSPADRNQLIQQALILAMVTVGYNLVEGLVSIFFGLEDETLSLFGFGLDSFVEVISGAGIWHMVARMKRHLDVSPDTFERTALRITGFSFYLLAASVSLTAIINLVRGHSPETTFWGIVISTISILTMWLLVRLKLNVGKKLDSQAIVADAHCTRTCLYLSVILLVSSLLYELTGFGGFDSLGGLGIAWLSFREGREAFEKARDGSCCCQSCK